MSEIIKNEEIKSLQKIVSSDFIKSDFSTLIPNNNFEELEVFKEYLTEKLKELLDHNFDLLVNTLYRIDVSEKKLAALFSGSNKENIPERLAELIIERQLQKIRFRQQYKEGKI